MKYLKYKLVAALLLVTQLCVSQQNSSKPDPNGYKIHVAPNNRVTLNENNPHGELHAAAHPTDPNNILVSGHLQFTSFNRSQTLEGAAYKAQPYTSIDGGYTWKTGNLNFPLDHAKMKETSVDPQVAFGKTGTAYFVHMKPQGKDLSYVPLVFYRSTDGGLNWNQGIKLYFEEDQHWAYDHPQIVIDNKNGNIYLSVVKFSSKMNVIILRSTDDGLTFEKTAEFSKARFKEFKGYGSTRPPMVLNNGTLIIPLAGFPNKLKKGDYSGLRNYIVYSNDFGKTFSAYPKALPFKQETRDDLVSSGTINPQFAIDNTMGQFKDNLYSVFTAKSKIGGKLQIVFSKSENKGETWSSLKVLEPNIDESISQFNPTIAVNNKGFIGISWADTRGVNDGNEKRDNYKYNQYFTASVDGGKTFLPVKRVSSKTSNLFNKKALIIGDGNSRMNDTLAKTHNVSAKKHNFFGHYLGLTANADGTFYPFWIDNRGPNPFQIYTAPVKVVKNLKAPINLKEVKFTKEVEVVLGELRYDETQEIIEIPISIRNTSNKTIYGPLTLEVDEKTQELLKGKENELIILNADNNEIAIGAKFKYDKELGEFGLEPGAITEPIVWKFKGSENKIIEPKFHISVTGKIEK